MSIQAHNIYEYYATTLETRKASYNHFTSTTTTFASSSASASAFSVEAPPAVVSHSSHTSLVHAQGFAILPPAPNGSSQAGSGGGGSGRMMMSFESFKDLLQDFDLLPQYIDVQVTLAQHCAAPIQHDAAQMQL